MAGTGCRGPTRFGHLARANPQWRTFRPDRALLVVFRGPHAYLSSRWYEQPDVPTWNYAAVHVYGKPRIVTDPEHLLACVTRQVQKYEGSSDNAFRLDDITSASLKNNLRGIVGFELVPDRIQASFKLSQNRKPADFANVIAGLARRHEADSLAVARMMTGVRPSAAPKIELSPGVMLRRATRESGCRLVQLTTDKRRKDAHRFYERLGFVASHEGMKLRLDPEQ